MHLVQTNTFYRTLLMYTTYYISSAFNNSKNNCHKYIPNFFTSNASELKLWFKFSGWHLGKSVESFDISWKYLNTATPSPHECSKFNPDVPSAQTIKVKDLSNHLQIILRI